MTAFDKAPGHWRQTTIGEIAEVAGGIQKQPSRLPRNNTAPFLRVANVQRGSLDLTDVHRIELFEGELPRFRLRRGDLLVVEGNGSIQHIGRSALWTGEVADCVHQNHLIRVRPGPGVLPEFLNHYWNSPAAVELVRDAAQTTSGLYTLSTGKVRSVPVAVPPLDEQGAIVESIERMLSVVDAASQALVDLQAKQQLLERSLYASFYREAILAAGQVSAGELLARIEAGKSYKCPGHPAAEDKSGVLKLGAVTWGEYDETENKELPPGTTPDPRWEVQPGDLLIGRANTAELVGATALVRTTRRGLYLSDKTLRLVPREGVPAEWIKAALAAPQARKAMSAVATGTSDSMRNISQPKIKAVVVPDVPADAGRRLEALEQNLARARRLPGALAAAQQHANVLRRSILKAAFEGRLTRDAQDAQSLDDLQEALA